MRFIITLIIGMALSYTCCAQQKARYKIKVELSDRKMFRGDFYAIDNRGLTLIRNRRDTIKLSADSITFIHVQRKGMIAPFAIAGGLALFAVAVSSDDIAQSMVLIAAGVPAGIITGTFVGNAISNRKKYKDLQPKDFPMVMENLKPYTVLK